MLQGNQEAPLNNAPAINAIIGNLAPQGIKCSSHDRHFTIDRFQSFLKPLPPGTPQPVPINIGINDLPDKPNFLKIRSMIKGNTCHITT